MGKTILIVVGIVLGASAAIGSDHKHPTDRCPPGTHTVTIQTAKNAEAKPGGIGGGVTVTHTHKVCRDNSANKVNESPKKR